MLAAFCIVSALAFMFICFIWSTSSLLNITIKMFFGTLVVWAIVCALIQFGFHT